MFDRTLRASTVRAGHNPRHTADAKKFRRFYDGMPIGVCLGPVFLKDPLSFDLCCCPCIELRDSGAARGRRTASFVDDFHRLGNYGRRIPVYMHFRKIAGAKCVPALERRTQATEAGIRRTARLRNPANIQMLFFQAALFALLFGPI